MTDIPKLGKILCIVCGFLFTIVCLCTVQRNAVLRREGDGSNRKLAEIITGAVLACCGLLATGYMLWEFV